MWAWWAAHAAAYDFATDPAGEPMRWGAFPVAYAPLADSAPVPVEAFDGAVDRAFAAWSAVDDVEVRFRRVSPGGDPLQVDAAPPNGVWVVDDWPYDPDLLALTSVWADQDGRIVAYDIELHGALAWSTGGDPEAFDLEAAMVHEVGHALGLAHSQVPQAAMYATALPGEAWRRTLDPDDEAGLRVLYPDVPDREPPPDTVFGAFGCATSPGSGFGAGVVALLLRRAGRGMRARLPNSALEPRKRPADDAAGPRGARIDTEIGVRSRLRLKDRNWRTS